MTTTHRSPARPRVAAALLATALVAGLGLAACGSDSDGASTPKDTTTTAASSKVDITDAWARKSPASTTMGAAYLKLTSTTDDALVGVSVDASVAKTAQIHETVVADDSSDMTSTTAMGSESTTTAMDSGATTTTAMGGGNMTMKEVDSIELPAGKQVTLKPGGYHVMLIDLAKPLEVGDTFELTLSFEHAADQTITVEVKEG